MRYFLSRLFNGSEMASSQPKKSYLSMEEVFDFLDNEESSDEDADKCPRITRLYSNRES